MNWKFCTALILIAGFILFFSGCAKESADRLAQTGNVCDTAAVKYSTQIVPIMQDNCYSCHGNGTTFGSGGVALYTYGQLKGYADNGYLVGNVTHAPGYVAMPYLAPALPTCETEVIVAWVRQGAPNN
jgi:mono/diheme cytochrome c family protein